ncbi:ATP synthase subunit I [Methylocucumis oryzae]|uniref:ATP synthase I n=1 Tax=Methylocucumis oryzae TaxID=1632867 RepID=A0A0F3IKM3_9GAMM|nr:ATP synthase subunit I [Methylocucumis oryzae]KJV07266.1 ATP synthase I [Methylocucumis oryzae]
MSSVVGKVLVYQLLITLVMTLGFAVAGSQSKAVSSILGGLSAFVPNLYFAFRISKSNTCEPRKILNTFYLAEFGKLLITAGMFVVIFQMSNLEFMPLFISYVTVLSVFWFALLQR